MKIRNAVIVLVFLGMAVALFPNGSSADYVFSVDKNYVDVYIERSGKIGIYYELTFTCTPSGKAIDIVDIGVPNKHYILSSATADLDGAKLKKIRRSEYVHPGIEVHLLGKKITPGTSGTLHFYVECKRVLYQDTEDKTYTSFRFSPTWFSPKFSRGKTDLQVSFHFPAGVKPDETKWHQKEFDAHSLDDEGRIVFTWIDGSASPSRQYTYGVSFPKKYVEPGAIVKKKAVRRRSVFDVIGSFFPFLIPLIIIMIGVAASLTQKRRLMKYMPPSLSIEGVGIKRGLTAVEAAILLEKPLDRVCTMILFGLLKKEAVKVAKAKPLRLEVLKKEKEELHEYESLFLAAVNKKGRVSETKLRKVITNLIKGSNEKMKGFSRRDTREYYRSIVNKAWEQVASSETQEVASEVLDKEMEWLIADERYEQRMKDVLGDRVVAVPLWYPVYRTGAPTGVPGPGLSVPSLAGSEFANSVVQSVEGFAHGLVGKVESFTGAITKVTNPSPVKSGSSWSSGGSGCACACACAGCACACAGGGR